MEAKYKLFEKEKKHFTKGLPQEMKQNLLSLLVIILCTTFIFSQETNDRSTTKKDENAELKANAVKMLKESMSEVEGLRTIENKISFSTEMSSLMWYHDEKEARRMFGRVIGDFVNLLTQYNAELESVNVSPEELIESMPLLSSSQNMGGKNPVLKMMEAMSVRSQIALAVAEHDAEMAFAFVTDTSKVITNEKFQDTFLGRYSNIENQILRIMSVQNTDKALSIGKNRLKEGYTSAFLDLAKRLNEKDSEKGRDLAEEIVSKIKFDKSTASENQLTEILDFGKDNIEETKKSSNKKPLFTENSLKEIAEILAQKALNEKKLDEYDVESYVGSIKPFLPARAIQIQAKYDGQKKSGESKEIDIVRIATKRAVTEAADKAAEAIKGDKGGGKNLTLEQKALQEQKENQKEILEKLNNIEASGLSSKEKEKFLAKARQIITTMPDSTQKITALSLLAVQVKQLGDKELASELMSQAVSINKPQPINYLDYLQTWMIIDGYSKVNAEEAFPILENTIYRLNDTISAFIKAAEFIDVSETIIRDGEVQLGMFGGRFVKNILGGLKNADSVLFNLAKQDFNRTRALAERFERTELRLMAKLLILQSVLEDKKMNLEKAKRSRSSLSSPPPPPPPPPLK